MKSLFQVILILVCLAFIQNTQASIFGANYTTSERDAGQRIFESAQQHLERILSSGDIVGNGGGYAEQNFSYIYNKLGEIYSYCLIAPECNVSKRSDITLKSLQKVWSMRQSSQYSYRFLAQTVFDSFFPEVRGFAQTGYYYNSMVYFNETALYDGQVIDDYQKITKIWTSVLAKQAGIKDSFSLRRLAKRISEYYFHIKNELKFKIAGNQISIWQRDSDYVSTAPRSGLLLNINGRFIDVLFDYKCRKGTAISAVDFADLAWNNPIYSEKSVSIELLGSASITCSEPMGVSELTRFVTSFGFKIEDDSTVSLSSMQTSFEPIVNR